MLALTSGESTSLLPLSQARVPVVIRAGELRDVPFMDSLQKMHAKMVGFFPTAQFEGNIKQGRVLIAEEVSESGAKEPVGYCIAAVGIKGT